MRVVQSELYRRRFRSALSHPARATNPLAGVEIHTLLCRRDVLAYLHAIKSLLFYHDDFSVVVHDDGSLSHADAGILRAHLPGIRIVSRAEGDTLVRPLLQGYPALARYRNSISNGRQLLDFTLLARTRKLISLDADILFLERPAEVLEWAAEAAPVVLVGHEKGWQSEQDWRLAETSLSYFPNINIGLMCYDRELVELDRAEQILRALPAEADWWTGQAAIAVLIQDRRARDAARARYLDGDRYIHNTCLDRPAVMKHYWAVRRLAGYWRFYRDDLKKTCVSGM